MNFFKRITNSITKPSAIAQHVLTEGRGGFGYFTLLALLLSVVCTGALMISFYPMGRVAAFGTAVAEELPRFELKDGHLDMDIEQPAVFEDDENLFILDNDTDQSTLDEHFGFAGRILYINPEGVTVFQGSGSNTALFKDMNFEFSSQDIPALIMKLSGIAVWCYFAFKFLAILFGGVFFALIIALFSLIIDAALKTQVRYGRLYVLAFYAMTIIYVIELVLACGGFIVPHHIFKSTLPFILSLIIALAYIGAYLSAFKKQQLVGELAEIPEVSGVEEGNVQ